MHGTCKKRHELAPTKKAYGSIPVPNEIEKEWETYRDSCKAWGIEPSDPIAAANAKGKKGKGKGMDENKGGKPKGDRKADDGKSKGKWTDNKGGPPRR